MQNDYINIIVFFGPPGIGKGTLAQKCNLDFGWKHLSTGFLCRKAASEKTEIGKKIGDLINAGNYIEDDLMLELVSHSFNNFYNSKKDYSETLILDGFPRNQKQILMILEMLEKKNINFKIKFVFFEASENIILERLKNRVICSNKDCDFVHSILMKKIEKCSKCNTELKKRKDDEKDSIIKRINNYNKIKIEIFPFVKEKLKDVLVLDANGEIEKIFKSFVNKINIYK